MTNESVKAVLLTVGTVLVTAGAAIVVATPINGIVIILVGIGVFYYREITKQE